MHSDNLRPLFRFFMWSAARISRGASRSMRLVQQFLAFRRDTIRNLQFLSSATDIRNLTFKTAKLRSGSLRDSAITSHVASFRSTGSVVALFLAKSARNRAPSTFGGSAFSIRRQVLALVMMPDSGSTVNAPT